MVKVKLLYDFDLVVLDDLESNLRGRQRPKKEEMWKCALIFFHYIFAFFFVSSFIFT